LCFITGAKALSIYKQENNERKVQMEKEKLQEKIGAIEAEMVQVVEVNNISKLEESGQKGDTESENQE
jgi:hypothetical protein